MTRLRCTCALFALVAASPAAAEPTIDRPNVVLIFCDDLGYGDLGVYGARGWATPNLDRLAAQGIRFTRFYTAQPVCSASRAALLTGCYPNRVGIKGALGPQATVGISDEETTLAELLKGRGYATAIFGKWHLGHHPQFLPTRHGFDEYFGLPYSNDMWPRRADYLPPLPKSDRKAVYPELPLFDGEQVAVPTVTSREQRQLTGWYTERAVQFIQRNKAQPFFLYVAHSMPHVPLHAGEQFAGKSAQGMYGDVIQQIDWSVGQITKALADADLDRRTLVLFTSDNGPWLSYGNHAGSAGPLREGKGTCWEGGVREPFIARWPGRIPPGSVCNQPAMTIDLLPTVAGLAGAPLPPRKIDGLDIWPLLSGDPAAKNPHEAYYFYYRDNELHAVASGQWKLYLPHTYQSLAPGAGGRDGLPAAYTPRKLERAELYDLDADQSETTDVAAEHPDVVARLERLAEAARRDLGDSLTKRTGSGVREVGRVAAGNQ